MDKALLYLTNHGGGMTTTELALAMGEDLDYTLAILLHLKSCGKVKLNRKLWEVAGL